MTVIVAMSDSTPTPEEREPMRRAIAEARAAVAEGRVVPHDQVSTWLDTWGKPGEQPAPKCE